MTVKMTDYSSVSGHKGVILESENFSGGFLNIGLKHDSQSFISSYIEFQMHNYPSRVCY